MPIVSELMPPTIALLGIGGMEYFFPSAQIDADLNHFEPAFSDRRDFRTLQTVVKGHALGWQVTVDLVYTFLASITILCTRTGRGQA